MIGDKTGTIFNIQRFSIHDGPGIRDLIFLKGCPLRCKWCANPESQDPSLELSYRRSKCIDCATCLFKCPQQALSADGEGGVRIDRARCRKCFACANACCSGALSVVGESCTAVELYHRIQKKRTSWRANGGITISGGEPLVQPGFTNELLQLFRGAGVDTALETCGYVPFEAFEQVAPLCNLIFYDLKFIDAATHLYYTGVSNDRILENILHLSATFPQLPIRVRTPLIPGINDGEKNLSETVAFLAGIKTLQDFELLPYHDFGVNKFEQLGRHCELETITRPDKQKVAELNRELRERLGLKASNI